MSNDSTDGQSALSPSEGAPGYAAPPVTAPAASPYGAQAGIPQNYAAPSAPGYPASPYTSYPAYAGQAYSAQPAKTNVLAIISMIAGIAGLTLLFGTILPSVAAVIMGHISQKQIRTTGENGKGMALAGLITGYVGLALAVIFWIIVIVIVVAFANYYRI